MSVEFFNLINVTGNRAEVLQFRKDARRRLSPPLKAQLELSTIDLSIEKLFRLHRIPDPWGGLPGDEGIYYATFETLAEWRGFSQARYTLSIKNNEIHELLLPISRCYPALCFVNSQMDDSGASIMSTFTRRGRQSRGELPEARHDACWKAAAERRGIRDMFKAYDDDDCRDDAEQEMIVEAMNQWDERVVRVLRRADRV
jgi:hypothetical protein